MRTTNITLDNKLSSNLLDMCESMPRDNVLYPFLSMILERFETLVIIEECVRNNYQPTCTFTVFFTNDVSNFFLENKYADELFEGYEELHEALFNQVVLHSQLIEEEEDMISDLLAS